MYIPYLQVIIFNIIINLYLVFPFILLYKPYVEAMRSW